MRNTEWNIEVAMYKKYFKRLFDILFCFLAIVPFLILLLIIAPIIFFDDRGKVFYSASRIGKNGVSFKMIKFRTMKTNAPDIRNEDGSTFNSENDPRLTRFGRFLRKTSLDEVPQILNVVAGQMSMIGPRPILENQLSHYNNLANEIKFSVKPGISGYAQINGRNTITWEQKDEFDRYYAEHINFKLDVKIFCLTILKVFRKEGVDIGNGKN